MSDIVIRAKNLEKHYTIVRQTERGRYLALRRAGAQRRPASCAKTRRLPNQVLFINMVLK